MEFESGFKKIVNHREISESGVLTQEVVAIDESGNEVEIVYENESGVTIDPKAFKLIYGSKKLQGSTTKIPNKDTDQEIVVKSLDGRKILG